MLKTTLVTTRDKLTLFETKLYNIENITET